jgi:glyoxylase I family protein
MDCMDSVRGDRQRIAHTLALEEGQLFDLHRHPQRAQDRSDEHRTGLDHIAFAGADRAGLLRLAARLNWLGILRAEIVDAPYGSGLSLRDPAGIALEFFSPPD